MTTPTVTELVRNGNRVGQRVELARYTIPAGERVLYGQRINGVVRFLPEEDVVLDQPLGAGEDRTCRPGEQRSEPERADAARPKRPIGDHGPARLGEMPQRYGATGERVELARYRISAGERAVCVQRVLGVVRVTDVPVAGGARSYLVERGLEQDGYSALRALVADYVRQAERLDEVPMACSLL